MNVITTNPIIYSSADGVALTKYGESAVLQTSPAPNPMANVLKGVAIKNKVIEKTKKNKPVVTPPSRGKAGIPKGSIPLIPPNAKKPIQTGSTTQTTEQPVEEKKSGFWASLSTTQKGLVVVGGAILAYMGYKKFVKKGK